MRFVEIEPEDLGSIKFTVSLLTKLTIDASLWLFGLSKDPIHRRAAEVCIEGDAEEGAPKVKVQEVALAIQLTSKVLDQLLGSGTTLTDDTGFAYRSGEDGARSGTLWGLTFPKRYQMPTAKLDDFVKLAISEGDTYLADFLNQVGTAPVITQATPPAGYSQSAPKGEVIPPDTKQPRKTSPKPNNPIDQFLNA